MATRKEKLQSQKKAPVTTAIRPSEVFGKASTWLLIGFTFLLYLQTVNYDFVLDDYSLIVENADTKKGLAGLKEIFSSSYRSGYTSQVNDAIYRPLPKAVYAVFWDWAPGSPLPGHLLNIIAYALLIGIIYRWLMFQNPVNPNWAFGAAALFAVLPIHTEVVANIKSLDEIAGLLFGILSLWYFQQWLRENRIQKLLLSGLHFFLSLLCKESAITFLALYPLLMIFFEPGKLKLSWKGLLVPVTITLLYLLIRQLVLGEGESGRIPHPADNMLSAAPNAAIRFTSAVALLGRYLFMTILPTNLSFDNSIPQLAFSSWTSFDFILAALVLCTGVGVLFTKKLSAETKFAIAFFFITVSVSSNLFVRIGTHWGERLMFAPSLGVCLLLSGLINTYFSRNRTAFMSSMAIVVAAYALVTITRTPVWEDNLSLYESGLRDAPNSVRTNYYIGNYYVKEDVLQGLNKQERDCTLAYGIRHLEKAIRLEKRFADPWKHLGIAYFRKGDHLKAIEAYRSGLAYFPDDPVTYNNMATSLVYSNRHTEALEAYARAVQLNPEYAEAWNNYGSTLGIVKKFPESIEAFKKAIQLDPGNAIPVLYTGYTYQAMGDSVRAKAFLEKAYALNPSLRQPN